MAKPILYSSWSSSSSSRVRIALALKKVDYVYRTTAIRGVMTDEQRADFYKNNPARRVPILKINGATLTESMAIIEYLDEVFPEPPLLPKDPEQRAHARAIAFHITSNIQPIQNLSVTRMLDEKEAGFGNECAVRTFITGFTSLEQLLEMYSGKFCVGDQLTVADLCLSSMVYNATMKFHVDITPFPIISRIQKTLAGIAEFQEAHPDRQPDAPNRKS